MRAALLLLLLATTACHPKPRPMTPGDSASADIQPTDTAWLEPVTPPVPDVAPQDTLLPTPLRSARPPHRPHDTTTTAVESVTASASLAAASSGGMPFGMTGYPDDLFGQYGITAVDKGCDTKFILPYLRVAAAKGIHAICNMPRKRQTTNGENSGPYSVSRTCAAAKEVRNAIPADSAAKYYNNGTWVAYRIMDDMGAKIWGGDTVSRLQVEQVYSCVRAFWYGVNPGEVRIPLYIRVHPSWIKPRPSIAKYVDGFFDQYVRRFGDIKTHFNEQAAYAALLSPRPRVLFAVNWWSPYLPQSDAPITAIDLANWGRIAIDQAGNCMVDGFRHDVAWRASGRGTEWDKLTAYAKTKTGVPPCSRP